jgi:4-diphosphocytidyl-2-C-methyl-D-erythritol kinase
MNSDRLLDALGHRVRSLKGTHYPLRAPAKVNLRLRVLGRLPHGYHNLSMVNGAISLADEIVCSFNDGCGVELSVEPPLAGTTVLQNLVTKALVSFVAEFTAKEPVALTTEALDSLPFAFSATITKKVPTGGGLGGGSSDAAAVLRLLVALFSRDVCEVLGISEQEFIQRVLSVAARCGADVPYSFFGGFAWVQGVGERVTPLSRFPSDFSPTKTKVLVVMPSFACATKEFYEEFRIKRPTIPESADECERELNQCEVPSISRLLRNDFEEVLCELYPAMGDFLALLRRFFPGRASITGSGSTLFAILQEGDEPAVKELECEIARLHGACTVASWE